MVIKTTKWAKLLKKNKEKLKTTHHQIQPPHTLNHLAKKLKIHPQTLKKNAKEMIKVLINQPTTNSRLYKKHIQEHTPLLTEEEKKLIVTNS